MVQDVITWVLLFSVFTSAFMVSFMGLQNARRYSNDIDFEGFTDVSSINVSALSKDEITNIFNWQNSLGGLWAPLWALFTNFDPARYDWMVSVMMWCYLLLSSVALVNLLVAMFADTYNKISEEAENEYIFLRCKRLFEFKDSVLPLPPVLNLPIIFRDIAFGLCNMQPTMCYNQFKTFIALRINTAVAAPTAAATSTARSFQSIRASVLVATGRSTLDRQGQSTSPPTEGPPARPSPLSPASGEVSPAAPKEQAVNPHNNSLKARRRRSLTTTTLLGTLAEPKKRRAPTIFDGKLLAQEYLKRVEAEENDTVYAHARSLRSELGTLSSAYELATKQREDEFTSMSTRVGGMEKQFGDIRESLQAIQAQLSELAKPASTVEAAADAPAEEPASSGADQ